MPSGDWILKEIHKNRLDDLTVNQLTAINAYVSARKVLVQSILKNKRTRLKMSPDNRKKCNQEINNLNRFSKHCVKEILKRS